MIKSVNESFYLEKWDLHSYSYLGRNFTDVVNAASLLFPIGEKWFVNAVRRFEDKISSPFLRGECKEFYKQEARHSREHNKLNLLLKNKGLDLDRIERETFDRLEKWGGASDKQRLLTTICLENITHFIGNIVIKTNGALFKPGEYKRMLMWHSREELEHAHLPKEIGYLNGITDWDIRKHMIPTIYNLVAQTYKNYKEIKALR